MDVDANLVIEELLDEIKKLNKEKAMYAALIKELNAKVKKLEKE